MIISGLDLVSDHDNHNGIFVTLRYNSYDSWAYRPSLCWIDQNGVQLACITQEKTGLDLNYNRSLIVDGVDLL